MKRTYFLMILFFSFSLAWPSSHRDDLEERVKKYSPEELRERLELLRHTPVALGSRLETALVLRAAGESGIIEFIPLLEDIAEIHAPIIQYHSITFFALDALWRLGKPLDYFLEKAASYETSPYMAKNAFKIIPRWPYDPRVRILVEETCMTASAENVRSWAYDAKSALDRAESHRELKSPEERVASIVQAVASFTGLLPPGRLLCNPSDPYAVWTHTELGNLSREHPYLVAKSIFERPANEREYLSLLISPEAQEVLKKMEQGESVGREDDGRRKANRAHRSHPWGLPVVSFYCLVGATVVLVFAVGLAVVRRRPTGKTQRQ